MTAATEDVVVRGSRLKAAFFAALCGAMAGACGLVVWMMVTELGPVMARVAYGAVFGVGFILCSLGLVRLLIEVFRPTTVLIAKCDGLAIPPCELVPWSEIKSIEVVKRSRAKFVEIRYSRRVIDGWVGEDRTLFRRFRGRLHRAGDEGIHLIASSKLPHGLRAKRLAELLRRRLAE